MEYYDVPSSDVASTFGAVGGVLLVSILFIVFAIVTVFVVLQIIGEWKVLTKGNQPGWAALIPIYNQYCLCKVAGVNPWWVLIVWVGSVIGSLIPVIGSLLVAVITIYFNILLLVSLSRSFGREDAFAIGLFFLQPIFMFILGKQDIAYLGEKPMNDVVMGWFNSNTNSNSNTGNATNEQNGGGSNFCSSCGAKVNTDETFCSSCGAKL